MSDITLTDEDVAAYGADDPTAVNAADPAAAKGSLVGTVIDPKDVTPHVEGEDAPSTEETPEGTTQDTEAAPTAPETTDPRLEVARLEGELKALREIYSRQEKPEVKPEPVIDLGPVGALAALPESEAMGKFQGLLEAGKYLDAQTFLSDWRSAKMLAPALKDMKERQHALAQAEQVRTEETAVRQLEELNQATKGEYKRYEKDIAALVMADAASRRLGNPPLFKNLKEVFDICKAKAGVGGQGFTQPATSAAKKALAKGPGSGMGGGAATPGSAKKASSPEDKVLEEFWNYGPTSL